jgi:hypothetical protein
LPTARSAIGGRSGGPIKTRAYRHSPRTCSPCTWMSGRLTERCPEGSPSDTPRCGQKRVSRARAAAGIRRDRAGRVRPRCPRRWRTEEVDVARIKSRYNLRARDPECASAWLGTRCEVGDGCCRWTELVDAGFRLTAVQGIGRTFVRSPWCELEPRPMLTRRSRRGATIPETVDPDPFRSRLKFEHQGQWSMLFAPHSGQRVSRG